LLSPRCCQAAAAAAVTFVFIFIVVVGAELHRKMSADKQTSNYALPQWTCQAKFMLSRNKNKIDPKGLLLLVHQRTAVRPQGEFL
jgi:hypothetical protein